MVISTIRIQPQPDQSPKAVEILRSVIGPTLAQPDCLSCRVCAEDEPERAILFCELWASASAFHNHVRSDLYRRVLAALELSSMAPEVSIHHVSKTEGIQLIQRLRAQTESTPARPL